MSSNADHIHIFCTRCSDESGLLGAAGINRVCLACKTRLANNDDAVLTTLNPSEDYKTSVLSGLSPAIITECAGRGLAFFSYQATQEIVYQEHSVKALSDKYSSLSSYLDQLIHDANGEIDSLKNKVFASEQNHEALQAKYTGLLEKYQDKTRQHQRAQNQFNDMCRQNSYKETAHAAERDSEHMCHGSDHGEQSRNLRPQFYAQAQTWRAGGAQNPNPLHTRPRSGGAGSDENRNATVSYPQGQAQNQSWDGSGTPARSRLPVFTPQTQRSHPVAYQITAPRSSQQHQSMRQPLGPTDHNTGRYRSPTLLGARESVRPGMHQTQQSHRPTRLSNLAYTAPH